MKNSLQFRHKNGAAAPVDDLPTFATAPVPINIYYLKVSFNTCTTS